MENNSDNQKLNSLSNFFKIPVGIYWVDPDGTILETTRYEQEMLGYSDDELVGKNIADIHVDKKAIEEVLEKVNLGVELEDFKTQMYCKDGSKRHVLVNSEVETEGKEYIHTRFFIRDITERGQSQLSNALLASIIDNSNDAIISKDLNGVISSWNDSAERIFGYTASEAIGQSITIIIPDERLDEEKKILNRLRRGQRIDHFETIREHKDGTRLNISLNISPIKDARGKIVGASKIARDITKRKRAEANLISYQNQLRSLTSKLSKAEEQVRFRLAGELHDNLGQLLVMSKMKLDQLNNKPNSKDLNPEFDNLEDLINEAIGYTRKLMTELKPPPAFDHEHLVTALKWVTEKMEKYDLHVRIEDDGQPKPIHNEAQRVLVQSVKEVLFNVIKHSGVMEAKINSSRQNNQVQVKVIDKGKGFDPRKDISTFDDNGGFGLFNIREQIDLAGGKVEFDSEAGKGTTVTLAVPLKDSEGQKATKSKKETLSETSQSQGRNSKIKVLLADDHKMMREGIRKLIESEDDFTVIGEASDGKKAVEIAQETSPTVIIMDVDMPEMNGIEATKKILSETKQTTVIGLSVHNSEDVEKAMREAGATVYLSKNEVFETLCATIRSEAG